MKTKSSRQNQQQQQQQQQRNRGRGGGGGAAGKGSAGADLQVFAAPVVLRPPSRHRPRRPPKTATGVSRSRTKARGSKGTGSLDLAYRQRPSTAGGLGGGNLKNGSKLLQITPMFKDATSRAAMGDSVFNFQKLADADGDLAKMAAVNSGRGRRRRKASGGSAGGVMAAGGGRRGRAAGSSMSGQSPRLARGQIGQTSMSQQQHQQNGMIPTVPGGGGGRRGGGGKGVGGGGGRAGMSPRMQRISKVR
jgi:hypothetical protein